MRALLGLPKSNVEFLQDYLTKMCSYFRTGHYGSYPNGQCPVLLQSILLNSIQTTHYQYIAISA
ncbi:hypothetical protein, partial [Mucilaginibacter sp. BT774]|uniref:hypothetical protein n=1 Tax=Mucilaginibacter sp. BT774 TaxID=3062276 RepID=UPI002675C8A5